MWNESTHLKNHFLFGLKDKYSSASDIASNKSGNWLSGSFTNTQFKIPSNTPFGTMKVTADVPYITNNTQKVCSYPYATDTLNSNPTLSNNNGNKTSPYRNYNPLTKINGKN